MGADLGSREEIADRAEQATYERFIRNLVFLPTVREIRQAVGTLRGLDPTTLERAIVSLGTEWRSQGRHAEAQLLDYTKTLIASFLPNLEPEPAPVTGAESLMAVLLRAPNGLRMRTALMTHQEHVTREVLDAARAVAFARGQSLPSKELCLAMYLIARAIDDREEMVTGLLMWSAFCREHGALGNADRHLCRAARAAEELDDPTIHLAVIGAQVGLYRATHRYKEACARLEEGLKMAQGESRAPIVASFADGLASCYRALGQPAKALDAVNRLLAVADQFPGRKSRALNLRGLLYEDLGRYEIGAIDYENAAKAAAAEGDRDQQFVAMTNAAASLLKRDMGRGAYGAFQGVLRQAEQWGNPLMVASTHNNLGHALMEMENYAAARVEYGKALAAKINSHDSLGEITALLGLASCEDELGTPESAKVFSALALMPAFESQDAMAIGQVQLALTDEQTVDDDLEGTLRSLRWTRDLAMEQGRPMLEAVLVKRIAALLTKAGRRGEALDECRTLLQARSGDSDRTSLLLVSVQYAEVLASRRESWHEAFDILLQQMKAAEHQMDETLLDARLAEIAGEARPVYQALLELLGSPWAPTLDNGSQAAVAFDLHESAKSRSLLAHLTDTAAQAPPDEVPLELRQTEAALLAEQRKWQNDRVPAEGQRYERLGQIREELKDCWERMRPITPDYVRWRSAEPYRCQEVIDTLRATTPGDTALVSFFAGPKTTTCFVLRADRDDPIMLSLPVREEDVKQAVRQLRRAFNGDPNGFPPYPPIRGDMPFKRKLDCLDMLSPAMAALFACLEGVELLCVAPHGPLHMIPLHALQLPGGQYLGDKYAVVYTPSLSVAMSKMRRTTAVASAGRVGDRAFVAGVSSADDAHPDYFEEDAALFDPEHWEVDTAVGVQGAARDAIIARLHGNRAIHISCHAFFNPANPLSSGLVVTNGRAKAPRDLSRLSFVERQNYLVTVRDLMRSSLDAELVTLSACSTGLQHERNGGDELEGFARALLGAGADSALLAMWNVDQASSREFLSRFYRNWADGMPKWKALQAARREFIGSSGVWRHPYHWAPFSIIGSWR